MSANISVDHYRHFQRSISTDNQGRDQIDREEDEGQVQVPWPEVKPPSRRNSSTTEAEIGRGQ